MRWGGNQLWGCHKKISNVKEIFFTFNLLFILPPPHLEWWCNGLRKKNVGGWGWASSDMILGERLFFFFFFFFFFFSPLQIWWQFSRSLKCNVPKIVLMVGLCWPELSVVNRCLLSALHANAPRSLVPESLLAHTEAGLSITATASCC